MEGWRYLLKGCSCSDIESHASPPAESPNNAAGAPMSLLTRSAAAEFEAAMRDAQNLIDIHRDLNAGRGRRWRETTLNRSVVVITVAAWQAYVEDVARGIVETLKPAVGAAGYGTWQLVKAVTDGSVARFNTPNSTNTRNVLVNVGFDPTTHWSWTAAPASLTPAQVSVLMGEWIRVRHTVAHGAELPPVSVLDRTAAGAPTLTRRNAESCMRFFARVVSLTDIGVDYQFP